MDVNQEAQAQKKNNNFLTFQPFPSHSVNLFTGPTSVGKTHYITHLINHYPLYFEAAVKRIVIVTCNDRVQPISLSSTIGIQVAQFPLEEFHYDFLEEDDLVVIDDIQDLTNPVLEHTISVGAHHYKLASLLLVTHSLLGNKRNFSSLAKVHRVFLFLRATSNSRLCKHLIDHFFQDTETQVYLKEVLAFCQRQKQVLAVEINSIVSSNNLPLVAFSHLECLPTDSYCIVYPMPLVGQEYLENFDGQLETTASASFPYQDASQLPRHSLVAVPAQAVVAAKLRQGGKGSLNNHNNVCAAEKSKWLNVNIDLESMIEDHFHMNKWQTVRNLAKAIFTNQKYCISDNGKYIFLHGRPHTKVSFVDFATVATRKAGPKETRPPNWGVYMTHVQTLLAGGAPRDIFKNKLLLPKKMT